MIYKEPKELYHHGIKGQKWGVRREQDTTGTNNANGPMTKEQWNDYIMDSYIKGMQTGNYDPDLFARNPVSGNLVSKSYDEYLKGLSNNTSPQAKVDNGKVKVMGIIGGAVGGVIAYNVVQYLLSKR